MSAANPGCGRGAVEPEYVERTHRFAEPTQMEIADQVTPNTFAGLGEHPLRGEDLPRAGLTTEPGRHVGHAADGRAGP